MAAKPSQLNNYVEAAKIEELTREWEAKGYKVVPHGRIGNHSADLIAERDNERIIFEVKTAQSLASHRLAISELARLASQYPNTTFRLVITNPPKPKSIEIEDIADTLHRYLEENLPSVLDELSTHTRIDSVSGVEVTAVDIQRGEVKATGSGVVGVELQYGSDGDLRRGDGLVDHEAFPFQFDVTLDADLAITEMNSLVVDTSSFYE